MTEIKNTDIIREIREALHLDDHKKKRRKKKKVKSHGLLPRYQNKEQKYLWERELPQIMKTFLKKRLHIGQHRRYVLPEHHPYIYGYVNDYSIINLKHTVQQLKSALRIISHVAQKRGSFMFVSTKPSEIEFLNTVGDALEMSVVTADKWFGGALTNRPEILEHLSNRLGNDDEMTRSERSIYGGIAELDELDLLVVLNPLQNKTLLNEARILDVPVVGLVDTHTPMDGITYPIVCNNENLVGVQYLTKLLIEPIFVEKEIEFMHEILEDNGLTRPSSRRYNKFGDRRNPRHNRKMYNTSKQKGRSFNLKNKRKTN